MCVWRLLSKTEKHHAPSRGSVDSRAASLGPATTLPQTVVGIKCPGTVERVRSAQTAYRLCCLACCDRGIAPLQARLTDPLPHSSTPCAQCPVVQTVPIFQSHCRAFTDDSVRPADRCGVVFESRTFIGVLMLQFFSKHTASVKDDVLSGLTVAFALVPEAVAFAFVAGNCISRARSHDATGAGPSFGNLFVSASNVSSETSSKQVPSGIIDSIAVLSMTKPISLCQKTPSNSGCSGLISLGSD